MMDFFQQYLPLQRGMSPHTICSYRDTLKLFLQFLAEEKTKRTGTVHGGDIRSFHPPEDYPGVLDYKDWVLYVLRE